MILSKEKPEIYERCAKKFGVNWKNGVIFTYGDTIYCKYKLPQQKIIHESVHIVQQIFTPPDEWWDKYIEDDEFRLSQEVDAYLAEIKWINENEKNLQRRKQLINQIVIDLSSPMYGSLVTQDQARILLKLN